ncbi:hypothetical protein D030_0280B, partial [Vibrio parahaemolyticus AQ3810]
LRAVAIQ